MPDLETRLRDYAARGALIMKTSTEIQLDLLAIAGDRHKILPELDGHCCLCGKDRGDPIHTNTDILISGIGVLPANAAMSRLRGMLKDVGRSLDDGGMPVPRHSWPVIQAYYNAVVKHLKEVASFLKEEEAGD